jgi:hypothetical protein
MLSRRNAIKLAAGGAAGALLGPLGAGPALAQKMTPLASLSQRNFHISTLKLLARSDRIAIPSFRFGIVMRNGIAASGSGGSANTEAVAELVGVDLPLMQQVAHLAFSDFVGRMRATGRTLLGWNEIASSAAFAKLEPTPSPFVKKPFADSRTAAVVAPEYLPLINAPVDLPLSDKGAFNQNNPKTLNSMSHELGCLVMVPSIVLDFAALSGSGHSVYGSSASVGVQPGLFLVPLFTRLTFYHAKISLFGETGTLILEDRVAVGQAGRLVQTASYNNRAEIEEWNSYVNSGRWWSEPNMAGPARPTQAYDYSTWQYRVDPDAFAGACLDAARAVHTIYLGAIDANRPA